MGEANVPGTVIPDNDGEGTAFVTGSMLRMMKTYGQPLGQIRSITGLEASVIQNWIKRGFVAHPIDKKYYDRHLARILLINALRSSMKIESIGELLRIVNGSADDESDDIISDAQLYCFLCETVRKLDRESISRKSVEATVNKVTSAYSSTDPEHLERLRKALTVMAYAYLSGELKERAESHFSELRKGKV